MDENEVQVCETYRDKVKGNTSIQILAILCSWDVSWKVFQKMISDPKLELAVY